MFATRQHDLGALRLQVMPLRILRRDRTVRCIGLCRDRAVRRIGSGRVAVGGLSCRLSSFRPVQSIRLHSAAVSIGYAFVGRRSYGRRGGIMNFAQ